MVTQFNTGGNMPAANGNGNGKSGSNTLLIVLGLAVAGFLVYKFVIKPAQDKKKQEEE